MKTATDISPKEQAIWEALKSVMDPEIPTLSVVDLGIITQVSVNDNQEAHVRMTPTFVGCPAIDVIKKDIEQAVAAVNGLAEYEVTVDYETAWNSNMMTDEGRDKLEKFGLAPPARTKGEMTPEDLDQVRCPQCGSTDTTLNSPFGSTLCRAIRFCYNCKQGFEQFKPV